MSGGKHLLILVDPPTLTYDAAAQRLSQVATHLSSPRSGREALLEKHPDDVRF